MASDQWLTDEQTQTLFRGEPLGIEHLGGVPWYEAPRPRRFHRCKPQTRSISHGIERCACGALRYTDGPGYGIWNQRNSRKRGN